MTDPTPDEGKPLGREIADILEELVRALNSTGRSLEMMEARSQDHERRLRQIEERGKPDDR